MKSIIAGIALVLCFSAAAQGTAGAGSRAPCIALDPVLGEVLNAPFLVFGEVHGTREVPDFVAAYLCAAAKQSRKVTLALEYPANQQAAIDAFMASPGTPQDAEQFMGSAFWRRDLQDGRTGVDMLRMYESIRALHASGADIKVVAIDGDVPAARRDGAMADNLRSELRQGMGRQVLALIGGLHAVRNKGNRFNPDYSPPAVKPIAPSVPSGGQ